MFRLPPTFPTAVGLNVTEIWHDPKAAMFALFWQVVDATWNGAVIENNK